MLILFGGLLGSGRRKVAEQFAKRNDFHPHDLDDYKLNRYKVRQAEYSQKGARRSGTEATLMHAYERAAADLPRLSKMYPDVVMQDTFHRAHPREYLMEAGRRCFDRTIFIWIESSPELVDARLKRMVTRGEFKSMAAAQRKADKMHADLETLPEWAVRVSYDDDAAVFERLSAIVGMH